MNETSSNYFFNAQILRPPPPLRGFGETAFGWLA